MKNKQKFLLNIQWYSINEKNKSYGAAEFVAKSIKTHTIAKLLIFPAWWELVKIVFGKEYEKKKIKNSSLR